MVTTLNATAAPATKAVTTTAAVPTVTAASNATAAPATLAVTTACPAPAVTAYPETSPPLELSGFSLPAVGPLDTIEWVRVTVTEHQSSGAMAAAAIELWDYDDTPSQVGSWTGTASTSTGNTSVATFTGITAVMLADLRVRIYGNAGTGGLTESVDGVALTVCYSPASAASATVTPATLTVATTFPAPTVTGQSPNATATPATVAVTTAQPLVTVTTTFTYLPTGNPSGGPWVISFDEEFSNPLGTGKPDIRTWHTHYIEGDLCRQETAPEIEWSPHNVQNMTISGGQLGITASYVGAWPAMLAVDPDCPNPSATVLDGNTTYQPQFVSGILSSHPSFQQTYGFFEARLQVPSNGNNWAGFWMNCSDGSWPPEIDIVEQNGSNSLTFAYHPPGGSAYVANYNDPGGGGDFTQWHTFGCRWTPTDITFYDNGVQNGTTSTNIATNPMHVYLVLAVRDAQHGNGSGYPCTMNVDYVRCWTKSGVPAAPVIASVSPSAGVADGSGHLLAAFSTVSGATSYRATACPADANTAFGVINAWQATPTSNTGAGSPITITGLTPGVPYNVTVSAVNGSGYYSPESAPVRPSPRTSGCSCPRPVSGQRRSRRSRSPPPPVSMSPPPR